MSNFKEKTFHIFFDGQIYDAYSLLMDIFAKSNNEIIIVDNYINKKILDILANTKKQVILITNKYNNQDYTNYQKQYNNITLKINSNMHDRYIIIDRMILYHCGASFKDIGHKCFAITKVEDSDALNNLLQKII